MSFFLVMVGSQTLHAQLTGTLTIPGNYATIALAVANLNAVGVGGGGVTFNVAAGHSESSASGILLTATGTMANPIVFQKNGVGANPLVSRTDAGSNVTSTFGGLGDAVVQMNGSDYVTFNGIDVAASDQGIEYGYFTFKPSGTDGCQFVTIMNCSITMTKGTSAYVTGIYISNGPTAVSNVTGVTVTASSGINESVVLIGNAISNVHAGIHMRGSSASTFNDQNPVVGQSGMGNIIQNYGGGSSTTTYGVYLLYQVSPTVAYNTIDNAGGGGSAHASTLYGIFYSTTVTGDVVGSDNNITLNTSGTSAVNGIFNTNTCTSITFNNNTFFGGTIATTSTSYLINASSATNVVTATGNTTSGTLLKTGASGLLYGFNNFGSPTGGTATISNNDFSNITLSGTSSFTGIRQASLAVQTANVSSNTISNIICPGTFIGIEYAYSPGDCNNNTIAGITGGAAVTGLFVGNTSNVSTSNIYGNNINTMSSTGASTVAGIQSAASGTGNIINYYKNSICSLSGSNASSLVYGLSITAGKTVNAYNNLIGGLTAPNATGTDAVRGISITMTTTTSNNNIDYNTIYLNASGAGNFGSSGIFHTTSVTATTSNLTMRNNIIYNNSTPSGTGVTAAYRRSSTANGNYNEASDHNLFWGGTPGATQLIFTNGTNPFDQLPNYQAYIITQDQNSVTESVQWESTTCGSADFLKYDNAIPSAAESGAANIGGITDDYIGTIRQGNGGYAGTGSAPDIGAWELEGALPSCGTPASANAQTTTPCNGQTFTLSLDIVYGLGHTYQWEESTVGAAGPYDPIVGANGATYQTSSSVTKWYRAVVTCVSSAMSTTSGSVLVTIPTSLSGVYTINNTMPTAGSNYNSFVDAINDLSCRGVSGPVTFNVTAGQTFASSTELNIIASGSMTNTITFTRSGVGANPLIRRLGTSGTTDYILRIGGGDYITFDGINFEQTGTSATDWVEYGIYLQNASVTDGAQNNTFRNGTVAMSNQNISSKGVYVHSSFTPTATSGTNSNNRFLNMTVIDSWEGYRIVGASTSILDSGNEINTESEGTSVIQNMGDGTTTGAVYGVFATHQMNFKVKNTDISDLTPGSTSLVYGIALQTAAANSAEFSGNDIHDITGGGTVNGIQITSVDTADIFNNVIYALSTTTTTSSAIRGIDVSGTGANVNIYNNQIYNVSSAGLTTTTAGGIDIGAGLVHNVYNNMISDIRAPSSTTTTGGTRGITVSAGSTGGVVRIYHNTVLLTDVGTVAGYTSAGLHNSSTTPTLDIRNNIVINKSDVTTGTRAVAFWKTAATDNVANTSNTNLYYAGTPGAKNLIYYDGTTSAQMIADYKALPAITPGEAYSVTEDVTFAAIVNGVLRPNSVTPTLVESSGLLIAGYASDFETNARGPYPLGGQTNGGGFSADLGADEGDFTYITPAVPDCPTLGEPANGEMDLCHYQGVTLTWTAAVTGGFATGGFDVYFGTSMMPPLVTNTSSTSYSPTGLSANETYYWRIVAKNGSGSAVGCATNSFTTVDAEITSTTPAGSCSAGSLMLGASGTGTLSWYAAPTGGVAIGTGNVFNTPVITESTDYYVAAGSGSASEAVESPTIGSSTFYTSSTGWGLRFTVNVTTTISTVTIKASNTSAGPATMQIKVTDLSDVVLYTGTLHNFDITTTLTEYVIPVDITLPPSTDYKMVMTATGVNALVRESGGVTFPYDAPSGAVSITAGANGTGTAQTTAAYYWFYNWVILVGCESPRVAVTAAIHDGVVVNNTNSDPGSLRANILCAAPNDVITFDASLMNETIGLTSVIVIDKNLTISGLGMSNLTISGGGLANIFHVLPGVTLTIEDIALKDGFAMTNGGAIYNQGSLLLEDVLFGNNLPYALSGPGSVDVSGTVNVTD